MALNRSHDYDASAVTADSPLSVEEVDDILDRNGKGFAKDPRKVMHFVRRVLITIRAYRQQIRSLQYDIAQERSNQSRVGQATTLSPMDAMRFMSDEQRERVFQAHFQEKLARLDAMIAESEASGVALSNERNRIRFAVAELVEDPTVDDAVRARLRDLLTSAVGHSDPNVAPVARPAAAALAPGVTPPPAPGAAPGVLEPRSSL